MCPTLLKCWVRKIIHKSQQYQISRFCIVYYFTFFNTNTPYCFAFILVPWYRTELFLYSRQSYGSHLSNMFQPSSMFIAVEIIEMQSVKFFMKYPASQTYLGHILAKSYLISDMSLTFFRHVSEISQTYLRHISAISQAYLRHISDMSQYYLRQFVDISQPYLSSI